MVRWTVPVHQGPAETPVRAGFLVPLTLVHDPMRRLLVVDIEGDEQLSGIELQDFDDPQHGRGSALLAYRHDNRVDWYYTPGLRLDRAAAEVGAGVAAWVEQDFTHELGITPSRVRAKVDVTLADGRALRFRLDEQRRGSRRGIDLLAPLGVGIADPEFLPMFYMPGLDLVQRRGTDIDLLIDDSRRSVVAIPVPIPYKGRRCYLTRHCADPAILRLNPATIGAVPTVEPSPSVSTPDGARLRFARHDGRAELAEVLRPAGHHEAWIRLRPGLPDITTLTHGTTTALAWRAGVDDSTLISGDMTVQRSSDHADLTMRPAGKWTPAGGWLRRLTIAMFPGFFRTWPTTYQWTARISLTPTATITSSWARTSAEPDP